MPERDESLPVLTISQAEIDRALPLPAALPGVRVVPMGRSASSPVPPPVKGANRLAIASLVCALAGIPLFGALTGLVAILLGAFALGAIRTTAQRGLGCALCGLILGIVDVVGWVIFISMMLSRPAPDFQLAELQPDLSVIQDLEPALQRAMRANVLIERSDGLGGLWGRAMGSGVILQIDGGEALCVTNRHVVDREYPSARGEALAGDQLGHLGPLKVRMLGRAQAEGRVVWLAPAQIDLAIVRIPCPAGGQARDANWQKARRMKVGESVFAIGNPHRLGWSHTQGVISQLRLQPYGARQIRVIQTQAAINPGNSGGGLYDQEGYLIGINTWTVDKRVAEGIGFAIALDALLELGPPLRAPGKDGQQ